MIIRKEYLQKLIDFSTPDLIKIVSGIRRCGKSTLLIQYMDYLKGQGTPDENILCLRLESPELRFRVTEADELMDYITEYGLDRISYLLIDEVQLIPGWEKVINSLHSLGKINIILTGSNSHMLSSNLGTLLTGRYVTIKMYPFSFREFMQTKEESYDRNKAFNEYVSYGGFPLAAYQEDHSLASDYLQDLLGSIIARDIIPALNSQVVNKDLPYELIRYINDSIGFPLSINSIVKSIKGKGGKTSAETITEFFRVMQEAYLIYPCELYSIKGKKRFGLSDKYYSVDTGFIRTTANPGTQHIGTDLENIVFLELLRRGYSVSTGRYDDYEIDFIATKDKETRYYQVSLSILSEDTSEREFRSLLAIKDAYPKYILTIDTLDLSKDGVIHKNIIDFLLEEK